MSSTEKRFFLFNKNFSKETIVGMYNEAIEKLISTAKINLPSSFFNYDKLNIGNNEVYTKSLEMKGLSISELKQTEELYIKAFAKCKSLFRSIKANCYVCDKIKENYSSQYNSLESLYDNISAIYL